DLLTPEACRQFIERSKLQTAVAGNTRNRRLAIQIAVDERLHYVALEFLFQIQNIERKAQLLRDATRVVNVIQRAAARRQRVAIFVHTDTAALVPQLHREADQFVPLLLQNARA